MVVLGVVLVLLALAVGILLVAGTASLDGTIDVAVPGGTLSFPPLTFLVTGMVVISVFWLGWVVLRAGVRHSRRRRAEAKEAARQAEEKRLAEEARLKEEFAARERQLIEERRRHESETAELKRDAAGGAVVGSGASGPAAEEGATGRPTAEAPTPGAGTGERTHDAQGAADDASTATEDAERPASPSPTESGDPGRTGSSPRT
jgi:hypothetical protein